MNLYQTDRQDDFACLPGMLKSIKTIWYDNQIPFFGSSYSSTLPFQMGENYHIINACIEFLLISWLMIVLTRLVFTIICYNMLCIFRVDFLLITATSSGHIRDASEAKNITNVDWVVLRTHCYFLEWQQYCWPVFRWI